MLFTSLSEKEIPENVILQNGILNFSTPCIPRTSESSGLPSVGHQRDSKDEETICCTSNI
ncbi:unnamed protein product, partial [Allacma fusca]